MIIGKVQHLSACWKRIPASVPLGPECSSCQRSFRNLNRIKTAVVKIIDVKDVQIRHIFSFVYHYKVIFYLARSANAFAPKIKRYRITNIAAEAVHVKLSDPVDHIGPQIFPDFIVGIVKTWKRPVARQFDFPIRIPLDKFWVLPHKYSLWPAVQVNKIQNNFQSQLMRCFYKASEILVRPIFLVYMEIVLHAIAVFGIIRTGSNLPVAPVGAVFVVIGFCQCNKLNVLWTKVRQHWQHFFCCAQRSFRRKNTQT